MEGSPHDRSSSSRHHQPVLAVYTMPGCATCEHAREMAERVGREFPAVAVSIVDLSVSSNGRPAGVFAVPTFMLDGETVSLGTPGWRQLTQRLRVALEGSVAP